MEDKTTDIQNEQYADEQDTQMYDEAGNRIYLVTMDVDELARQMAEKWKRDAEAVENIVWGTHGKPGNGIYDKLNNSPEPVQDIYTSLEQIREDIAAIIRDGELTYPQTLNKLQEIVNKLDKTIDHGSYIQSDGTK